jgi:DNA-binding transcriptional MerR regulator
MMRIGALAKSVGVSVDAIRIYEARGLIWSGRQSNGYRDFPEVTVEQVRLIRLVQSLGFPRPIRDGDPAAAIANVT